jgi:hypothetical protein
VPPDKDRCASCNAELSSDDLVCRHCGEPISRTQTITFMPKMTKYGWVGILLALIPGVMGFLPGFFSIYGLGHIYFRKWSRGILFLMLSALMYYIEFGGLELNFWTNLLFGIVSTFIFLLQLMEAAVLAFMPRKTAE